TGLGILEHVMWSADARLSDLDYPWGDARGQPCEGAAVDLEGLEVPGVDADDAGASLDGPVGLGLVVHLDQSRHPQGLGPLTQADQGGLVKSRDNQQNNVGAVGARLPQLVRRDHEVLAEHGDLYGGAHGSQVLQAASETAPLGQDADHAGP